MMNELLTIRGDHYEFEMNVICLFQLKRYKYIEMPVQTIYLDNNSNSHFSPGLDTYRIQTIIWQYDLVPLIGFIFGCLGYRLLFHFFGLYLQFPMYELPLFAMARRSFIEGLFFAVKGTFALGIFTLLVYVCKWWSPICYFISTFVVCFINYFLALIIFKCKKSRREKRAK